VNLLRKYRLILAVLFLLIFCISIIYKNSLSSSCDEEYRHDATIKFNSNQQLNAELARTESEREKGLGNRSCVRDDQAMLFVFGHSENYDFWMKNMRFPIDIIWVDSHREVTQVTENVSPKTYPKNFTSDQASQYVLEVKAGQAAKLGIISGTKLSW